MLKLRRKQLTRRVNMISIELRYKRQLNRQKATLRRNIGRSLTLKESKLVFKVQNTNNHLYIRVYQAGKNDAIITVSTIKYSKMENNKGQRKIQILSQVIDELINILKEKDIWSSLDPNQIIWYLGGGKFQGRIKAAIDIFSHNLNNSKDNAPTDSTEKKEQDTKN